MLLRYTLGLGAILGGLPAQGALRLLLHHPGREHGADALQGGGGRRERGRRGQLRGELVCALFFQYSVNFLPCAILQGSGARLPTAPRTLSRRPHSRLRRPWRGAEAVRSATAEGARGGQEAGRDEEQDEEEEEGTALP